MKKLIYIILFGLLFSISINAQKQQIIEKNFALPQGKRLDLDLKFGTDITVNTWNKQEVLFKAIILYYEEGIEKIHTIDIDDNSSILSIATDYDFEGRRQNIWWNCNQTHRNYYRKEGYCISVNYEITLPVNAKVRLETIAGNIEVKGFKGDLKAKSISGFVDVALEERHQTKLKFKSVTGEIYTDFDIDLDRGSTSYSKKLTTIINGGGGSLLALETISGDIFFRKL